MSVKKYFGLTAAGIASLVAVTSAMAGGPDVMAAPAPDYSGFYVDANVGWGGSNWSNFQGGVFNPTGGAAGLGAVLNNGTGGFAWGGDIGYQFNQYFSFETGAYDLEDVTGSSNIARIEQAPSVQPPPLEPPEIFLCEVAAECRVKVQSWVLYVAGKLSIPLFQNLDVFGKVGIGWRFLYYSGRGVDGPLASFFSARQQLNDVHYATWLAGVGLQYWFTPNWSINVQYLHFPGYNRFANVDLQSPNVNLVVGGIGYKFNS